MIKKYGYPSEIHNVTTDDGYILEIHRIAKPGAIPVLLTHGLLDSSATWVLMGPNKGLGKYNVKCFRFLFRILKQRTDKNLIYSL